MRDANAATVFWQANLMNPRGQVTQEQLGNGILTNRAYDPATGWLSSIQSGLGGGAGAQNESYLFDLVGNVTQRQNNNQGLTENFYYDHLHRLDYSTLGGNVNLDLSYDAMGNITSRSDVAGGASWTYHATKRHAVTQAGSSSYTYSYDANGNAITRNGYSISWSSYNYPLEINGPGKQLTFTYDAHRQRIQQVYANGSTTETTTYVGKLLEKVTVGSLTDWRHYIHAGSRRVAVMSRSSTGSNVTRYILEDHQNSIAQITDNAGANFVSESFTAFGARRDATTWNGGCNCDDLVKMKSVTRKGYTGHDAIGGVSLGLNHMNGRVQDAITGRFLSPDPYVQDPLNTQSFNRYAYVFNNPLSYTDPSGFKAGPYRFANWIASAYANWVDVVYDRSRAGSATEYTPDGARTSFRLDALLVMAGFGVTTSGGVNANIPPPHLNVPRQNPWRNRGRQPPREEKRVDFAPYREAAGIVAGGGPDSTVGGFANDGVMNPIYVPPGTVAMNLPNFVYQQCAMSMCHGNVDLPFTHGYLTEAESRELAMNAGLTVGSFAVTGVLGAVRTAAVIDTAAVRFTQSSVSGTFSDGRALQATIDALRGPGGDVLAGQIPAIRIFRGQNGLLYTLDNRRLLVFSAAGRPVPFRWATADEIAAGAWKQTATREQLEGWFIRVKP